LLAEFILSLEVTLVFLSNSIYTNSEEYLSQKDLFNHLRCFWLNTDESQASKQQCSYPLLQA